MTWEVKGENHCLNYGKVCALDLVSFPLYEKKLRITRKERGGENFSPFHSMMASFRKQTSGIFTIDGEEPFENKRIMQNVMFVYNKDFKDDSSTVKAPSQIITEGRIVFPSSCTII